MSWPLRWNLFVLIYILAFVNVNAKYYVYGEERLADSPASSKTVNCGECPPGFQRSPSAGEWCGQCLPVPATCRSGFYLDGTNCVPCPCTHASGCERNRNGEIICHCLPNYSGKTCDECAQGCTRNPDSPDDCIQIGFPPVAPCVGNSCTVPTAVVPFSPCQGPTCQDPRVALPPLCPGCNCQGYGCACDTCHVNIYHPPYFPPSCPPCYHHHQHCPPCNSQCSTSSCNQNCSPCQPNRCQCPPPCPTCCNQPKCPTFPPIPPCPRCPDIKTEIKVDVNATALTVIDLLVTSNFSVSVNCTETPPTTDTHTPPKPCNCEECDTRGMNKVIHGVHDESGINVLKPEYFCACKANVQGTKCNTCKPGHFGLHESNPQGCDSCFCSGMSQDCHLAQLYVHYHKLNTSEPDSKISVGNFEKGFAQIYNTSHSSFVYQHEENEEEEYDIFYWKLLATQFSGNLLSSYSGILSFTRYIANGSDSNGLDGVNDIIIVSKYGWSLYWGSSNPQRYESYKVKIDDHSGWLISRNGFSKVADRRDIMEVLVDVQSIYIRATAKGYRSGELRDVKLSYSSSNNEGMPNLATSVEHCVCPPGYTGYSCEDCNSGYVRVSQDTSHGIFGKCVKQETNKIEEKLSVTLSPVLTTDCLDTRRTFTCNYTGTDRLLVVKIRTESDSTSDEEINVSSNSKSVSVDIVIRQNLKRVICEIKSHNNDEIEALVSAKVFSKECNTQPKWPLYVNISHDFLCMYTNEKKNVTCAAVQSPFATSAVRYMWLLEGRDSSTFVLPSHVDPKILELDGSRHKSGTYVCVAVEGKSVASAKVNVVIKEPCNVHAPRNAQSKTLICRIQSPLPQNSTAQSLSDDPSENEIQIFDIVETKVEIGESVPKVHVTPIDLQAFVSEYAVFQCKAANATVIMWEAESGQFATFVSSHGILEFPRVKLSDAGFYKCIAENKYGRASMRVSLNVTGKPFGVRIHSSPPSYQAVITHPLILTCEGTGEVLAFKWNKESGSLPQHSLQYPNGTLLISSMEKSDAGIYICSAESPDGQRTEAKMRVKFGNSVPLKKPEVKLIMKSPYYAVKGDNIRLHCHITAEPVPTVTWTFTYSGHTSSKVLHTEKTRESHYEIERINESHEGNYTCQAKNELGEDEKSLEVFVIHVKCQPIEFHCKMTPSRCTSEELKENKCKVYPTCISTEKVCDGTHDCEDGSDELHYMCARRNQAKTTTLSPRKGLK